MTRARRDCIKRNITVKVMISALITLGIFCAIFAIRSCRWFVFLQDESSEKRLVQDWSFLPESDLEATISVGIFRYQLLPMEEVYDDDENSNATTPSVANEAYTTTSNEQCVSYPEFWVGVDYPWKFATQLCSILGSIVAFASWCVMIVGADRCWICIFLVFAAGLQCATIISSLSWCDQYWNCPWLLGFLINLVAMCLFLMSWALAVWGLVESKNARSGNPDRNAITNQPQSQKGGQIRQNPERDSNSNESTDAEESCPSSIIITNEKKTGGRNEKSTCTSGEIDSQVEDVEHGPKTIPFYVADQLSHDSELRMFESFSSDDDGKCSIADKELYYDSSFDDDTKSAAKPIFQTNQTFQGLNTTSTTPSFSSDSSDDNKTISEDASSTDRDE